MGTGASGRRRRRKKLIRITREITTVPPTAAPMMTAVFELLVCVGEEAPEAGFMVEEGSPKPENDKALMVVGWGMVAVEGPSIAPGVGSGRSKNRTCLSDIESERKIGTRFSPPTVKDLLKSQLISDWEVI